jgi:hypothetical protein
MRILFIIILNFSIFLIHIAFNAKVSTSVKVIDPNNLSNTDSIDIIKILKLDTTKPLQNEFEEAEVLKHKSKIMKYLIGII